MATTLHRFLELPWEIQARIWELSVEPRTVKVRRVRVKTSHASCSNHKGRSTAYELVTNTPVPAAVQTCYQARYKHGLYQRVFSELDTVRSGEERRYVWLNLDIDTVDVGFSKGFNLWDYESVARSIRRLKFETAKITVCDRTAFQKFENLQELHIICLDEKMLNGLATMEGCLSRYLPCSVKKVIVHHTASGFTRQWDESVGDNDRRHVRGYGTALRGPTSLHSASIRRLQVEFVLPLADVRSRIPATIAH